MYEQHFGLKKRPFSVKATGNEVFVGPQTAKTMAGFRKALAAQDAVVTVSGAVGTGKTTLVERSLDAIGSKYKTIRVGRMQMNPSDVLESLLIVLGVKDRPSGTIQRFTALRRKLKDLQDAGTRVFILVEDALRTGAETLAELEALTVAEAGESDGASIVLMGDERLFEFMKKAELAQLQQRVRQRHRIQPLCEAELRGYLKHCLRLAGGDFEQLFDARSAELLHGLSQGIPRVANTIVDTVLTAAASQGVDRVTATMIAAVASDELGLSVEDFDFSEPAADDSSAPDAPQAPSATPQPVAEPEPTAAAEAHAAPEPVSSIEPSSAEKLAAPPSEPVIVFADDNEGADQDATDIPHLIQDTLPDLAILSQRYATLTESEAATEQDIAEQARPDASADDIPELKAEPSCSPEAQPTSTSGNIADHVAESPQPDGDSKWELAAEPEFRLVDEVLPTLESEPQRDAGAEAEATDEDIPELRAEAGSTAVAEDIPELAVEPHAVIRPEAEMPESPQAPGIADPMPVAGVDLTNDAGPQPEAAGDTHGESDSDAEQEELPEWDRDPTLAQLKPDLDALEQAMAFTHGEPLVQGRAAPEPEDLADAVADVDEIPEIILDKSIETGIEDLSMEQPSDILPPSPPVKSDPQLDRIAADIANAKSLEDIDDIMAETLFGTGISMIAAQITANPPQDDSANDELELVSDAPAKEPEAPPAETIPDAPYSRDPEEISIETRPPVAKTGLDLSASQRLKTVRALNADLHPSLREPRDEPAQDAPESIEDQINTSITQTLKALKVPLPGALDETDEDEPKKGFLSRFRRS